MALVCELKTTELRLGPALRLHQGAREKRVKECPVCYQCTIPQTDFLHPFSIIHLNVVAVHGPLLLKCVGSGRCYAVKDIFHRSA